MNVSKHITHERVLAALSEISKRQEFAGFEPEIAEARAALEKRDSELSEVFPVLPETVQSLIRLQLSGLFDKAQPSDEPENLPDDTGGIVSSPTELPSAAQVRDMLEKGIAVEPQASTEVTFLFMADPQVSRAQEPKSNDNPRVKMMNGMNKALNKIDKEVWPAGMGLQPAIEGTPIAKPKATFFGGDLCQTGGDYNFLDQSTLGPALYQGGFELEKIRCLFDKDYNDDGLTKLKAGDVYFGLGNHDVQTKDHPAVGWSKGCLRWSTPSDYWRWQMWNFICQMHRGVFTNCIFKWSTDPTSRPSAMDARESTSNEVFYWQDRSLVYFVDLGPVDVYQLHVYGGDTEYGRASGLDWVEKKLKERGTSRPVIIVQHYDFGSFSIPDWWTEAQRDKLLNLLEPYNVVAFLMGHNHTPLATIPFQQAYPAPSTKMADEFRPGSAGADGNFAVLRVTDNSLNIMQGYGHDGTLAWRSGYSKTW